MRLQGKVALVTGSGSGMGKAMAVRFAQEGAKVSVADINEKAGKATVAEIKAAGGNAHFIATDVAKPEVVQAMIAEHKKQYGRLDVLVNNAAYEGVVMPLTSVPDDEINKTVDTTLKSVLFVCKYAIPLMVEGGGGSVINVASVSAATGFGWPNMGAYVSCKGGVTAVTRALAKEYAAKNIRVNTLNPGLVLTPMLEEFATKAGDKDGVLAAISGMMLLGRLGKPEELANAALFLASDEASYVTGSDMMVDGGLVLGPPA